MGRTISDIAQEIYGEDSRFIVKSFDQIGDIIVIKIPTDLIDDRRYELGRCILENYPYIKVVLRQTSPVEGLFRIRKFEHIAGEKRTYTIYKEHGCRFYVDISKVYFTPRLSYERRRIADLVGRDEIVFNMFAGVGPYSILMAKRGAYIHSVDINPYAFEYHILNNRLNRVEDRISTYRGDSGIIAVKYLSGKVDRVVMPLPELAIDYLKYAVKTINREGWIHVYLHIKYGRDEEEALEKAEETVKNELIRIGDVEIREVHSRIVREVATRTAQICVDIDIVK